MVPGVQHPTDNNYVGPAGTGLSQNYHMIPGVQYPTNSNNIGPAAVNMPPFDIHVTNSRIPPMHQPSGGVQPVINAPTGAQQLAQAQPFVATPAVHLPGQVYVATPASVFAAPGIFLHFVCDFTITFLSF